MSLLAPLSSSGWGARRSPGSRIGALLLLSLLAGCGGGPIAANRSTSPERPTPIRSAAEDAQLRSLLLSLAERHLCDRLRGQYVALPDADVAPGPQGGRSPSAGRLWIERCAAEARDGRLGMHLEGPGWTWVEREASGPAGSSFLVRGHLRFDAEIELEGELDLAYVEGEGLVSLWLTPRGELAAAIEPTGSVPVSPEGGWSAFVAALGGLVGPSIEARARPIVEAQGSAQLRDRLSRGFTFTVDLCRGQPDSIVGSLGNGERPERPYPADGLRWLANQRVRLRAGGLDAAGPFQPEAAPLHVDLEVEQGEAIEARVYCQAAASTIIGAHLREAPLGRALEPLAVQRVEAGAPTFLEVEGGHCPLVLLVHPLGPGPTVYRMRAYERGARAEALIECAR